MIASVPALQLISVPAFAGASRVTREWVARWREDPEPAVRLATGRLLRFWGCRYVSVIPTSVTCNQRHLHRLSNVQHWFVP